MVFFIEFVLHIDHIIRIKRRKEIVIMSNNIIELLPHPSKILELCRSMAAIDAIFSPDKFYRYHQLNISENGNHLHTIDDNCGNVTHIYFKEENVVIIGIYHELYDYEAKRPNLNEVAYGVPEVFKNKLEKFQDLHQGMTF